MSEPGDDVLFERRGRLGAIVLNRPQAMNALTHQMVQVIASTLDEWETDDNVATVLISGAGERGLCAGGDIVSMYHDALAGGAETEQFWRDEYALNARIARYPKPYVAFMDGVVLGGGIGVSAHGSHRIVTERTRFGMPEVGIGFAPDVGGSYLLARAPGETGTHLAMSGGMGSGADAVALGFADYYVPSERLGRLAERLEEIVVADAIAEVAKPAPHSELLAQRSWIDACYEGNDAVRIVERLQAAGPHAQAAASAILGKSPTGVTVALQSVRRVRELGALEAGTLEEVLNQEYRVSVRFIERPEIVEGIRAQVIDKDRNPQWMPSTLDEVSPAVIEHYFSSLGERELGLHFAGPAA
ncbi:MAG: enoyl-CoA hydratase/isomerase family protein [Terrimesophilobacter sp.]